MEIQIDPQLSVLAPTGKPREEFLQSVPGIETVRVKDAYGYMRHVLKPRDIIGATVPMDADVYHDGYFGYMRAAYNSHTGVVIDPTFVWYTVLAELAGHVKENAEHYRPLFTTAPGKTEITIQGLAEAGIDPREFLGELRSRVPMSVDLFLPELSTATPEYDVAASAAFCDAVSPYYNYSMMLCGIRSVRVEGTSEDWDRVLAHLVGVVARLDKAVAWADKITPLIDKMRLAAAGEVDVAFWKDMYHTERCGSGGQVKLLGWFRWFAMTQPQVTYPENYPTHVSKVEVTQRETGRKYNYCAGLLSSRLVDGYLVPTFSSVTERLPAEATADAQPVAP